MARTTLPNPIVAIPVGSMLSDDNLPTGYGRIETTQDAVEQAFRDEDDRVVRITIVWDVPVSRLELDRVLDDLRGVGAAMVVNVERVR